MCKIVTARDNTDPFKQSPKNTKKKWFSPGMKQQNLFSKNSQVVADEHSSQGFLALIANQGWDFLLVYVVLRFQDDKC